MKVSNQKIRNIPIDKLEIWDEANVRKIDVENNIDELSENIKQNGIENPLLVKEHKGGYLIFAGQRRFLASQQARINIIPCRVFSNISLKDAMSLSLSENIFSRGMTTMDKANSVKELLNIYKNKSRVCKILGIKMSSLQVYLAYHGLPTEIKRYVDDKYINMQFALNVVRKFSRSSAIDIIREVCSVKKKTAQRGLLVSAILDADGSDSLYDIKQNIKNVSMNLVLHLDSVDSKKLQKLANAHKLNVNLMALKIIKGRISRF